MQRLTRKLPHMRKYKLLKDDTINLNDKTLYRIQALRSFSELTIRMPSNKLKSFYQIKEGDLGGYIENECNLSHDGECWVMDSALVYDYARVYGNAVVADNARVYGYAKVYDYTRISMNGVICGKVRLFGNTQVYDNAKIYDNVMVGGRSIIHDDIVLCGDVYVYSDEDKPITLGGNVQIGGDTRVWFNDPCYSIRIDPPINYPL